MMNPKQIFKMLRVAGIKIKIDVDRKAFIIIKDGAETVHTFEDIEKMVNG